MITLRVNGKVFTDFTSARVIRSIETLSGAFSLESTSNTSNLFPIKIGDSVQVLADDSVIVTGYVENLEVGYDDSSHSINISGRDLLGDLLDSTVPTGLEFVGSVSFVTVVKEVLKSLNFRSVRVINESGNIPILEETDYTSPEVGQNAFDFLESFARKRQILLTTDGLGNIVLARAGSSKYSGKIQNIPGELGNNIKSASLRKTTTNRFNRYEVQSQLTPISLDEGITPGDISSQNGIARDSTIRSTRQMTVNAEESMDSQSAIERAKWEANIRRSRSIEYSATVQGHSINNEVWQPNRIIKVRDTFCNVSADLLIKAVEYSYSLDGGSTSSLTLVTKDSYTLQSEQDQREANTSDTGESF